MCTNFVQIQNYSAHKNYFEVPSQIIIVDFNGKMWGNNKFCHPMFRSL